VGRGERDPGAPDHLFTTRCPPPPPPPPPRPPPPTSPQLRQFSFVFVRSSFFRLVIPSPTSLCTSSPTSTSSRRTPPLLLAVKVSGRALLAGLRFHCLPPPQRRPWGQPALGRRSRWDAAFLRVRPLPPPRRLLVGGPSPRGRALATCQPPARQPWSSRAAAAVPPQRRSVWARWGGLPPPRRCRHGFDLGIRPISAKSPPFSLVFLSLYSTYPPLLPCPPSASLSPSYTSTFVVVDISLVSWPLSLILSFSSTPLPPSHPPPPSPWAAGS